MPDYGNVGTGASLLNQTTSDVAPEIYRPCVHAPRSIWFIGFLGIITWNLYFCFWAVGRARDLKRMRRNDFIPGLWFFAPLIGIVQLFALVRMFSELKAIEGDRLHQNWHQFGWLWISLIFISGLIGSAAGFELIPGWIMIITLLFDCALLMYVHERFNSLKRHDEPLLEFHGRSSWYYWWEWAIVGIASLLWALIAYAYWDTESEIVKDVPQGYLYKDTDAGYEFSVNGMNWRQMEIGTYSDGSAKVEFGDTNETAYLLVFEHDMNDTLNGVASWRFKDVQNDFKKPLKCNEERSLSADQKQIESLTLCSSEKGSEKYLSLSKLVWSNNRIYELLGAVKAKNTSYSDTKKALLESAASFSGVSATE